MTDSSPSSDTSAVVLASADEMRGRARRRGKLKGRQPEPQALAEVQGRTAAIC